METIRKIKNMDNTKYVCIYDIQNLTYNEIVDDKYEVKRDIGFYVKVNDDMVGVMPSLRGPIFFVNDSIYILMENNYKIEFSNESEKKGRFKLIIDNEVVEDIIYNFPLYTDYDPWSKQEEVDFFQWMYNKQESFESIKRFHEFYIRD